MKENAYEMPGARTMKPWQQQVGCWSYWGIAAEMLTELPPELFWWMTGISGHGVVPPS